MNNPLISVVVPIYNVEKYLDRCITSIVNQTYKNLEIILVDDGSPDNCPQICDEWAKRDNRIRVIHKQNAGLGMARNTGIENATGEYIFFFDSDDYVDITLIEQCVDTANNNEAEIVIYGHSDVYANGSLKTQMLNPTKKVYRERKYITELLSELLVYKLGFGISTCMKMFDLNLIKRHGFKYKSEREIISEDLYFLLEIFSKATTVAILPKNLYYYYKRNDSLTKTYKKDRQEKNNLFLQKSLELAQQIGYSEQVSQYIQVRYHFYTIAAMKQILQTDLDGTEKRKQIYAILNDELFRKTLTWKVVKKEKLLSRILFFAARIKWYSACYWMIKLKSA